MHARISAWVESARFYRDVPGYIASRGRETPVVRIRLVGGPAEGMAIVTTPELALPLLRSSGDRLRTGEANAFLKPVIGERGVLVLDGDEHRRMRRVVFDAVQQLVSCAESMARQLVQREVAHWRAGSVVELHPLAEHVLFEVMRRVLFGDIEPRRDRDALAALVAASRSWGAFFVRRDLGPLSPVRRFRAALARADARIARAIASPPADCVASALASAGLDTTAIRDNVVTLFLAGHGSTATSASWVVHDLIRAGGDSAIDPAIRESLRIHPPFELLLRRVRGGAVEIDDHVIADGAIVGVSLSAVHGDAAAFDEPTRFRPSRFASGPPSPAYLPYGYGNRRCLGAGLAHAIIRAIASTILERARLRAIGPPERRIRRGISFVPARRARALVEHVAS